MKNKEEGEGFRDDHKVSPGVVRILFLRMGLRDIVTP